MASGSGDRGGTAIDLEASSGEEELLITKQGLASTPVKPRTTAEEKRAAELVGREYTPPLPYLRKAWLSHVTTRFGKSIAQQLDKAGLGLPNVFAAMAVEDPEGHHEEIYDVLESLMGRPLARRDYELVEDCVRVAQRQAGVYHGSTQRALENPSLMENQKRKDHRSDYVVSREEEILYKVAKVSWVSAKKRRRKASGSSLQSLQAQAVQIAVNAGMPVTEAMARVENKDLFAQRICGSYREKTLRKHLREAVSLVT
jgi:hypothetical protein